MILVLYIIYMQSSNFKFFVREQKSILLETWHLVASGDPWGQ